MATASERVETPRRWKMSFMWSFTLLGFMPIKFRDGLETHIPISVRERG